MPSRHRCLPAFQADLIVGCNPPVSLKRGWRVFHVREGSPPPQGLSPSSLSLEHGSDSLLIQHRFSDASRRAYLMPENAYFLMLFGHFLPDLMASNPLKSNVLQRHENAPILIMSPLL